jgi:transcription-repair coupling factor (superfamily II helicase)
MELENIINVLFEKGFEELKVADIPSGFFFRRDNITVLVVKYEQPINIEVINEEILSIRNYIFNNLEQINIWNTYAFILTDKDIDLNEVHILEKDASSIRKYVISSYKDLGRIYFLDSECLEKTVPLSIAKTKSEEEPIIKELYRVIKDIGGETKKLKPQEVKYGVDILTKMGDDQDEN